ncbi:membrane protein, partial [Stenotrophomonas humi]
ESGVLLRARAWASWLGFIPAALVLPLEMYSISKRPGWASWLLLAVNVLVVWVLARDIGKRRKH